MCGGQDKPRWLGSRLQGRQPPRPVRDPTLGVSLAVRWRVGGSLGRGLHTERQGGGGWGAFATRNRILRERLGAGSCWSLGTRRGDRAGSARLELEEGDEMLPSPMPVTRDGSWVLGQRLSQRGVTHQLGRAGDPEACGHAGPA